MANANLTKAKKEKNDEFYTQYKDVENELQHYTQHFKNKIIYCNCDNPTQSNFWNYLYDNYNKLKLKSLISTYYIKDGISYKTEYNGQTVTKTQLNGDGDFRNEECINILKESDIVITNPPFSLFREYILQLMEYDKKFLIIGSKNAITYKDFFPLIKDNKVWLGYNSVKEFNQPDNIIKKFGNIGWFTNLNIVKRYENLDLCGNYYFPEKYPKYNNYDAINVDKVTDIPCDYYSVMGVPITFLNSYCPEQFDIVGLGIVGSCEFTSNRRMEILDKNGNGTGKFTINAKGALYRKFRQGIDKKAAFKDELTGELYCSIYARILIKRKDI